MLSPSLTDLAGGHLAGVGALWRALPLDLGRVLFPSTPLPDELAVQFPPPPHIHQHSTSDPALLMPDFYPKDIAWLCVDVRADFVSRVVY